MRKKPEALTQSQLKEALKVIPNSRDRDDLERHIFVLKESRIDGIIQTMPSIIDRANLMVHLSVLGLWSRPVTCAYSEEIEGEKIKIVRWIKKTWDNHTVRAKMARKIAGMIEVDEHLKEEQL